VCDLETSRIGAPYIYNVRLLRVNDVFSKFKQCVSPYSRYTLHARFNATYFTDKSVYGIAFLILN